MTRLSPFIRSAPKLFYIIAAVDFLRNCLNLSNFFVDGSFLGMGYGVDLKLQLVAGVLAAIVYIALWVACGVIATLLIAIFDEVARLRTHATESDDACEAAE
jgi:uncharacterized membrane protein YGL010W